MKPPSRTRCRATIRRSNTITLRIQGIGGLLHAVVQGQDCATANAWCPLSIAPTPGFLPPIPKGAGISRNRRGLLRHEKTVQHEAVRIEQSFECRSLERGGSSAHPQGLSSPNKKEPKHTEACVTCRESFDRGVSNSEQHPGTISICSATIQSRTWIANQTQRVNPSGLVATT